jgi:hypothetical protein
MAKEHDELKNLTVEERMLRFQERQLEIQERQLAVQEAAVGVQKAQVKQTAPKSLQQGPKISVFNPRGEKDFPVPPLKCEILAPWQAKPEFHGFDREEVELLNLLEPGESLVEMGDGSVITVHVVGVRNGQHGKLESLTLCGAYDAETKHYAALFTKENKQLFPAFRVMLRQMIGERAAAVMPMREEVRRIALPEGDADRLEVSVGA